MKKITLWISLFTLGLFFVLSTHVSAETIKNFQSEIIVNTDSSVNITETILYDSEGLEKHGIFRDITPTSSEGKTMEIKDISVTDADGALYLWQRQTNAGDVRLKIGDPNVTFHGEKTYIIHYKATNAVAHLKDKDEIYWNVTGNNWPFSTLRSEAYVRLPEGVTGEQFACYRGGVGSNDRCDVGQDTPAHFINAVPLAANEGMTVAVGFPAGIIHEHIPTVKEKLLAFLVKFWPLMIPVITFIYMYRRWSKKGRDPKGTGIIVPQYEVVDNLTPLEAAVVIKQKFNGTDIIAEVLSLAVRGYINITQSEEKHFLRKSVDYILVLKKAPDDNLTDFDTQLLQELFNFGIEGSLKEGKTITLSKSYSLFGITGSLSKKIKKRLVQNEYYTKDFVSEILVIKNYKSVVFIIFFIVALLFSAPYIFSRLNSISVLVILLSMIITSIIFSIFHNIMPSKTPKGVSAKEHLLGLKHYIDVAEKDRIAFHNDPSKNSALFESLLPYAVIFGLEKKWAKAFEGLLLPPPSWYSSNNNTFVPTLFISDFSNSFSQSFFSAASSGGGSGGRGFSGGGGGGGGGGSW